MSYLSQILIKAHYEGYTIQNMEFVERQDIGGAHWCIHKTPPRGTKPNARRILRMFLSMVLLQAQNIR
jgi:hypothetical protein